MSSQYLGDKLRMSGVLALGPNATKGDATREKKLTLGVGCINGDVRRFQIGWKILLG